MDCLREVRLIVPPQTVSTITQTGVERTGQQRWVLLCHEAVNNVLGHIGVMVDLWKKKQFRSEERAAAEKIT